MKPIELKEGMRVYDRWYLIDWGVGIVQKILKTRVKILFTRKGLVTYDRAHLQFLEKSKIQRKRKKKSA